MIPSVEDILGMLLRDAVSQEQALAWINRHVEMASEGDGLRDHFAGLALAAMIGKDNKDGANCGTKGVPKLTTFAYEYADAMLKARTA